MLANHRLRLPVFLFGLVLCVTCIVLSIRAGIEPGETVSAADPKLADGLAAWEQVYSVLTSPRCINCHTATNYPQQGDDRHHHFANVIRGPDGKGVPALNCVGCHQTANADSTGVPGGPDWHLAPLSMRWQDANDQPLAALVLWAWNPGRRPDGTARSLPPLTHAQFVAATRTWVDAGAPCPRAK